jgi:hypothetical protein
MQKDKVFTIRIPDVVYKELQQEAEKRDLNTADLIRKFIRLGLIAVSDSEKDPKLMLKDGENLRPVWIL